MSDKVSLKLDPDSLTLGDLADFEDEVGKSVEEVLRPHVVKDDEGNRVLDEDGRPVKAVKISARALIALVWLVNRKDNPAFTLAEARKVRVDQLEIPDNSESEATSGNE